MPNIKSKKKHVRQTKKRTARNKVVISRMRSLIKRIRESTPEEAKKLLPKAYSAIDKASKGGYIKKQTGTRYKSRLAKTIKK